MIGRQQIPRAVAVLLAVLTPCVAAAQQAGVAAVEGAAGWAAFPDESLIHHAVLGGAARFHLTPRISVGPELTYMVGPGDDRDLFVLGNVFFDFRRPRQGSPTAVPFVVAGAGRFHGRNRFGGRLDTHNSGTFALGGGVRLAVSDRVYVAPDVRLAVEDPHVRATVTIGVRFGAPSRRIPDPRSRIPDPVLSIRAPEI